MNMGMIIPIPGCWCKTENKLLTISTWCSAWPSASTGASPWASSSHSSWPSAAEHLNHVLNICSVLNTNRISFSGVSPEEFKVFLCHAWATVTTLFVTSIELWRRAEPRQDTMASELPLIPTHLSEECQAETITRPSPVCGHCLLPCASFQLAVQEAASLFLCLRRVGLGTLSCHVGAIWGHSDTQHGHEQNAKISQLQWSPSKRDQAPELPELTPRPLIR